MPFSDTQPGSNLNAIALLAEEYPEVVAQNAALRLTVAADLSALETAPRDAIKVLVRNEPVSELWLRWGSRHENWRVRKAVAGNPQVPVELLGQLARDDWPAVREAVAEHRKAPAVVLKQLAADGHRLVRLAVA